MPSSPCDGRRHLRLANSRLDQSLLRLNRNLETLRDHEERVETLFTTWQQKWISRRDEIARRLEVIDAQLEKFPEQPASHIRLAVVGMPHDSEELLLKGSF